MAQGLDPDVPLFTHEVEHLDHDELTLHPISDVHIGASGHHERRFKDKIDRIAKADESHRVLLLGDLADVAIKESVGFSYGARTPDEEQDFLIQALKPIAERVDLIIPGNHERRLIKTVGIDFTRQLAVHLGRPQAYRPATTVLRYKFAGRKFGKGDTLAARGLCEILAHHGRGGGRAVGSKIKSNLELRLIKPDCDIYVSGHTHERAVVTKKLVSGWPPRAKLQRFCSTGCFLGTEMYSMNQAYEPAVIGAPVIRVWVKSAGARYDLEHSVEA